MRIVLAIAVGMVLAAAFAVSDGGAAVAQMPPHTPPPVPSPLTPDTALEGTIASLSGESGTLQTPDGRSIRLFLPRKGYLLVDPTSEPLSNGMRVFAHGFPRADGTVAVAEIDVLVPLNMLMQTPAPAST
jgi:hypothetical protein